MMRRVRHRRARPWCRGAISSTARAQRLTLDVPPALTDPALPASARRSRSRSGRSGSKAGVSRRAPRRRAGPGGRPRRARRACSPSAPPTCRAMPARSRFRAARSIRATRRRSPPRCARPRRRSGSIRVLVEPIGYLDLYLTFTGFRILPVVARVVPGLRLALNASEVDDAFEVPLAFLMDDRRTTSARAATGRASSATITRCPIGERYIWGVTAGILRSVRTGVWGMRQGTGFSPRRPRRTVPRIAEACRPVLLRSDPVPGCPACAGHADGSLPAYDRSDDPPVCHRARAVPAPFVVYALFLWATRAGVLRPVMAAADAHAWLTIAALALMIGELPGARRVRRRAAGLDLCAGAHGERAGWCRGRRNDERVRLAGRAGSTHRRARRACSPCSTATARRRASSAAPCATRCSALPLGDIDIATTAVPRGGDARAPQRRGFKAVPTGIDHGTVTVVVDGTPFEVTTLREDVETFGRNAKVAFGRDWKRDAERRDFTMNALSVSPDGMVHDYVGGLADLEARRVRFIGDPATRIARGLSAHPALLPLPRRLRRTARPMRPGCMPASWSATACARCRASACAWS